MLSGLMKKTKKLMWFSRSMEIHYTLPTPFFFFFLFWHLICSWLLHFYDHCLWSSMTHINGRASFLGNGFLSLMLAYYWTWLLWKVQHSFSLCLCPNLMGRPLLTLWKTLITFPWTAFQNSRDNNAFRVFLLEGSHICFIFRLWITLGKLVYKSISHVSLRKMLNKLFKTRQSLMKI